MNYRTMKLFLTVVEHDEAQVALARALRHKIFSPREGKEKDFRVGQLMLRRDRLVEEIQNLEGMIA